jgi:hypothetical protein
MKQFIFKKSAALLITASFFVVAINAQPIYKQGKRNNPNSFSVRSPASKSSGLSLQSLHCFGGSGDEGGFSNFMTQTNDGGFISCSYSNSTDGNVIGNHGGYDVWLVRFDASGTIQWKKSYGGSGDDFANRAIQTTDGGYLFLGYTTSNDGDVSGNHGEGDLWVVKLDVSGNITWQKTYGGSGDEFAYYGIIQTRDGGYAAIGSSASHDGDPSGNHGGYDILILKLSGPGVVQWTKTYGGSEDEYGNLIVQNNDGSYSISADSYSNNGNISGNHGKGTLDTWIARLNSNGNIVWKKSLGGSDDEFNASLITTHDGCILVGDYAGSHDGDVSGNHGLVPDGGDMWLVKINSGGNIIWTKTLGGGNGNSPIDFPDDEVALFLSETSSGELLIAGGATSSDGDLTLNRGSDDAWVLRLDATGNIIWQKSFGGSGEDAATGIFQINNGGYTVAGWSSSNDYDFKHSDLHGGSDLFFAAVSADNTSSPITQLHKELLNDIPNEHSFSNFPNPFSESTNISFFLPKQTQVSIKIYDLSGRLIRTLVDQKIQQGSHTFKWNTTDQSGNVTSAGLYFLRMDAANYSQTRKILITK